MLAVVFCVLLAARFQHKRTLRCGREGGKARVLRAHNERCGSFHMFAHRSPTLPVSPLSFFLLLFSFLLPPRNGYNNHSCLKTNHASSSSKSSLASITAIGTWSFTGTASLFYRLCLCMRAQTTIFKVAPLLISPPPFCATGI